MLILSIIEFFLTADITPKNIPIRDAKIIAHIASQIVAENREKISFATGVFV